MRQNTRFTAAVRGDFSARHARREPSDGTPVSIIYAPIEALEKVVGILIAVVDLNALGDEFITPVQSGQTGTAKSFRGDGTLFFDSSDTPLLSKTFDDYSLRNADLSLVRYFNLLVEKLQKVIVRVKESTSPVSRHWWICCNKSAIPVARNPHGDVVISLKGVEASDVGIPYSLLETAATVMQ